MPPYLVATGLSVLTPEIFAHPMIKIAGGEEFGLPPTLIMNGFGPRLAAVYAERWLQMNTPEHRAVSADELAPFLRV